MLHFLLLLHLSTVFLLSPHVHGQDERWSADAKRRGHGFQAPKHQHVSRFFSPLSSRTTVDSALLPPYSMLDSSPKESNPNDQSKRSNHSRRRRHRRHHRHRRSVPRSKVIQVPSPSPSPSLSPSPPPSLPPSPSPPPASRRLPYPPPAPGRLPSPPPAPTRLPSPPPAPTRLPSPPPASRRMPSPPLPPSKHAYAPPPAPGFSVGAPPPSPSPIASYPPPPYKDCDQTVCLPPLTKTPFMSPCGCVRPIEVKIDLSIPLYSLFPVISVLATDLAEGTVLSLNQVEISGANADSQNPDMSIVDVNLVPLDQAFDNLTALLIFQRFWNHELVLNSSLFGNYSVIYVHYPGLPPSPPSSSEMAARGAPGFNGDPKLNPIGVNVEKPRHRMNMWIIAVIAVTSAIALVGCIGCFWMLLLRFCRARPQDMKAPPTEAGLISARTKRSGGGRSVLSSDLGSSTSMSFSSSMATYTSNAKTFTLAEIERATDNFSPENVIGEGGFGRVYYGVLDDGLKVAVKSLTRDEGGKEFIAEVEMLSRLHHRNLVKLIGICTEDHSRCLVYELIPNGSVESHLHGVDKETAPLDWKARMKIALGSARGLAYLHEDSNPRVIHRDFKASNILLENDFNPKVSDFGLAKAAPDEGRGHLSTRVMGTFGYVAPEYAMTGHLLVKSDVYSYGVVLLELLTGRKPVDMSQPPGQENLVTWARPLLNSKEGLNQLVDPWLGNSYPKEALERVAAIASMCVQPEVSHRPFMGEVVQALKLVYNEGEEEALQNGHSSNASQGGDSSYAADSDTRAGARGLSEQTTPQHWLNRGPRYHSSSSYDDGDGDDGDSYSFENQQPLSGIFPEPSRFLPTRDSSPPSLLPASRHSISGADELLSASGKKQQRRLRPHASMAVPSSQHSEVGFRPHYFSS